jgi:hypothetical protein
LVLLIDLKVADFKQINKLKELKKIQLIAKTNVSSSSQKFVDRIHKNYLKNYKLQQLTTLTPETKNEDIQRAAITYYPDITNRLQNIFKKHNKGKISDIVGNSKDKCEQL